jgi:hypothetical protein
MQLYHGAKKVLNKVHSQHSTIAHLVLVEYNMYSKIFLAVSALLPALSSAQQLICDPGVAGPPLELVHLFYDQWPTGATQLISKIQAARY